MLLSTGSLKFRQLEIDEANGQIVLYKIRNCNQREHTSTSRNFIR